MSGTDLLTTCVAQNGQYQCLIHVGPERGYGQTGRRITFLDSKVSTVGSEVIHPNEWIAEEEVHTPTLEGANSMLKKRLVYEGASLGRSKSSRKGTTPRHN